MDDIRRTLHTRFPLLRELCLYHESVGCEELATFMGVLLATMQEPLDSSFCFVIPRKHGIAPLSSVLYALGRFAVDYPRLAQQYASRSFATGQRVRVIPRPEVFHFSGVWSGASGETDCFFKLESPNKKYGSFAFPISDIVRLEATTYKRPIGKNEHLLAAKAAVPDSPIDRLLGTRTWGNDSLASNYVLYLGNRREMDEFLSNNALGHKSTGANQVRLSEIVQPGTVSESGVIQHSDQHKYMAKPLIATSSRLDSIAAACRVAEARSKVVVVDGARRINDFASFDEISATQNLIILSEPEDEDHLRSLYDRGCRFWRLSLADIELGASARTDGKFFAPLVRSARNEGSLHVDFRECHNAHLEGAASALGECQRAVDESEDAATNPVLKRTYNLLCRCAGMLAPPSAQERQSLLKSASRASDEALDRAIWLPRPTADLLTDSIRQLVLALGDSQLGVAKAVAFRSLLAEPCNGRPGRVGVVAASIAAKGAVAAWIANENRSEPVLLPTTLADDGHLDRIVCPSWPGSRIFQKIIWSCAAPLVTVVGYPFELQWLSWFTKRRVGRSQIPDVPPEEKSRLIGVAEASFSKTFVERVPSIELPESTRTAEIDLEDRMMRKHVVSATAAEERTLARLVSFVGDAYACLTKSYQVLVITDLLATLDGAHGEVAKRSVADLRTGDFVVFRERGRRDVIQSLADASLGSDAAPTRELASRWHEALRSSGLNEEQLVAQLEEVNCPRTVQTVRGWLNDDSKIGPQTKDDLEAIAYASGNQPLLDDLSVVWSAIERLRSEHLSAGRKLSRVLLEKLPERLVEIAEGRTRIDIDETTSAWVVQVDSIAPEEEPTPKSYVNALLWDLQDTGGEEV